MPQRISKVVTEYAGRAIAVGEAFHVEPEHVHLLLTLGRIEPVEGEPGYVVRESVPDTAAPYMTRDMNASSKRNYSRKAGAQ